MKVIMMVFVLLFHTSVTFSGKGHSHHHSEKKPNSIESSYLYGGKKKIGKEETGVIGRKHIERLVREKKINASWMSSDFEKSKLIKNEWSVVFIKSNGEKINLKLSSSGLFLDHKLKER